MVCTGSWRSVQADGTGSKSIESSAAPGVVLESARPSSVGGKNQKGTPWECGFSLHSVTIDNFCLVFLQWLNKTKIQKPEKQEAKKTTKKTQWPDPTLCHYSPPWGVQSFFLFLGFLFSGSLLVFLKWPNKTKIQKPKKQEAKKTTKKTQWPDPTLCHYSHPWGVQSCVFLFFVFLVSCFFFFVFWFVVGFLKGSGPRPLCRFSHFMGCKLAFGWFYYLLWACGSIRKQCKKLWQNAGITGGSLGGLGHKLGNFVCLCNLWKTVLNKCKNIGS